jgi:predicted aspartyl protease
MTGHVDDLGRPLVRIRMAGLSDSVLALIDTGFDAEVLIPSNVAHRAGYYVVDANLYATLATGISDKIYLCDGEIEWFGNRRAVTMLVRLLPREVKEGEPAISIVARRTAAKQSRSRPRRSGLLRLRLAMTASGDTGRWPHHGIAIPADAAPEIRRATVAA